MTGPTDEAEVTRGDRFKTAVAILGETDAPTSPPGSKRSSLRSKTSLRASSTNICSKDELLLALFDRTTEQSAHTWR